MDVGALEGGAVGELVGDIDGEDVGGGWVGEDVGALMGEVVGSDVLATFTANTKPQ